MEHKFILSCESTVDMPYSYISGRDISVIFYTYMIDGVEYVDDMGRDPESLERFYAFIADGKLPTTSQINAQRYYDYFDELLKKGDVLHINFASGMTASVNNAYEAQEKLREKYPDRKLVVIDSYCSCGGYGLLVEDAADRRDEGMSFEEVEAWVNEYRHKVHHQFFSTDLTMFRRGGRVSGPAAMVGTLLGICPIMNLDPTGHIIAYDKVKGKKKAIEKNVDEIVKRAENMGDYDGKFYICHSHCPELAEMTIKALEERMPKLKGKIRLSEIGTIIASHTGVGTVASFFYGVPRNK